MGLRSSRRAVAGSVLLVLALVGFGRAAAETPDPIAYSVRFRPVAQEVEIDAAVPTHEKATVELMMARWSPGFYRIEDYASRVKDFSARAPDGTLLSVEQPRPNRWRIETRGAREVKVTYRLECTERSVTTNWVGPEYAVLNGPATFITLVEKTERPHEVSLDLPPRWNRVMTALDEAPEATSHSFRAPDFETLADSPILAGDLDVQEFDVAGSRHALVIAGDRSQFTAERAARNLEKMVRETRGFWAGLPFERYVFLVVFRQGGGALEHERSTLVTANPSRIGTPEGYRAWLALVSHEYFHAWNGKRLRPVELGPFDYENEARSRSLWIAEGLTSYYGDLMLRRAELKSPEEFLSTLSSRIRELQTSPGRLHQSLEQSSREVWNNSLSGVNPDRNTVSYYVKGQVVGFLLDAKIRRATHNAKSLDDVMALAYARYSGERGFTPEEFRKVTEEVAGVALDSWFKTAVASTDELDYQEALDWFGLRFATRDGRPAQEPSAQRVGGGAPTQQEKTWKLEIRDDGSEAQASRRSAWLGDAGS